MPSWPGTLPSKPLQEGFSETAPDVLIRTQMDAGPAKVRRRFTAAVRPFSMVFMLTATQVGTLDSFYVTTCSGGALSFTFNDPRTGTSKTFRFTGPPAYTNEDGDIWRAVCALEMLP